MKFIDCVDIAVKAGDGGSGCGSFRREKYIPKGGPDGGDGGRGGSVIVRGDEHLTTLLDFRYQRNYSAKAGGYGEGNQRHGKDGEDIVLHVPLGTVIVDKTTQVLLCDITQAGQEFVVAKGGRGGRGNVHFKSSVNQAPRRFDPGEEGEQRELTLELKLLADVGLVGCPNAGKSTLVSRFSAAKPKVADYPFTTLNPVLGVVQVGGGRSYVMADIPGLIEGAHAGVGLGDEFLRHIERCRLLLFVIDISLFNADPWQDYQMLLQELSLYKEALVKHTSFVALNKIDVPVNEDQVAYFKKHANAPVYLISGVTGEGCAELGKAIQKALFGAEKDEWS